MASVKLMAFHILKLHFIFVLLSQQNCAKVTLYTSDLRSIETEVDLPLFCKDRCEFPSSALICITDSNLVSTVRWIIGEMLPTYEGKQSTYRITDSILEFLPNASGNYQFSCSDDTDVQHFSTHVIPYRSKFKKVDSIVYPLKTVYHVGDKIVCESKYGTIFSYWFFENSTDGKVPFVENYHEILLITPNFPANVIFTFNCEEIRITFSVARSPYQVMIKKVDQSLVCLAKGTDLKFLWRTYPSQTSMTFHPIDGNILDVSTATLDIFNYQAAHRVTCIALGIEDTFVSITATALISPEDSESHKPHIIPALDKYKRSEIITCHLEKPMVAYTWICTKETGYKEIFSREGAVLPLRNGFFADTNADFSCFCVIKSHDHFIRINFKMKAEQDTCRSYNQANMALSVITLIVMFLSAFGPCRFMPSYFILRNKKAVRPTELSLESE